VRELRIRLDLLAVLTERALLPATCVTLVGARLTVQRNLDGSLGVFGLTAGDGLPAWLSRVGHYRIVDAALRFKDMAHPDRIPEAMAVGLVFSQSAGQPRMKATVKLPPRYGGSLDVVMALTGSLPPQGPFNGQIYAETRSIKSAQILADYLPFLGNPDTGLLDSKLWIQIKNAEPVSVQGEIALTHKADRPQQKLTARIHWHRTGQVGERWRLDVPELVLLPAAKTAPRPNRFSIASDFFLRDWAWSVAHLNLQDAAYIGQWLAPGHESVFQRMGSRQPTGSLVDFIGLVQPKQGLYALRGKFNRIGFAPLAGQPGVAGVSGTLVGNQELGSITFATAHAQFSYPGLFRQELAVDRLSGNLTWRQTEHEWHLSSPFLSLELPGIRSTGKLHWVLPKQPGRPFLDWQMTLSSPDVSQLKRYLPAGIMKPVDVKWFDTALVKGRIERGRVLYYGPLGPLEGAVLRAVLDIDGVALDYDPAWPSLTGVKGRVSLWQDKLVCEISQGHSRGLNIATATITHPAIGASNQLLVQGEVEGALPDALAFLGQSELNEDVGGLIAAIETQGQTRVFLDLALALTEQGRTRVNGRAQLRSARVKVNAIDLWLERINGDLKFNQTGVYSDPIRATVLNQPVALSFGHDSQKTRLSARGKVGVAALKNRFELPFLALAQGTLAYRLSLDLPRDDRAPALTLFSDLAGVALALPGPLAKSAGQRRSLMLRFDLVDAPRLPLVLNYGNLLKANLMLDTDSKTVYSGNVLFGPGTVKPITTPGLNVEINQPNLDLSLLAGLSLGTQTDNARPLFAHLAINSGNARWHRRALGDVNLALAHKGADWVGRIASGIATGNLQIPVNLNPKGTVALNLQRLDLAPLHTTDENHENQAETASLQVSPALNPRDLPLLAVTSQQFLWRGVNLGQFRLQTERIQNGVSTATSLIGSGKKLTANGRWEYLNGQATTALKGAFSVADTGRLLNQMDITTELKEAAGTVDFAVAWDGGVYDFWPASGHGTVDVAFKNGRILSIEPGFGRLLGLLAMAQWPKRLQLDFRDVFEDGLSFNSIEGHFSLERGMARTANLAIDAIPAKIRIAGNVNLSDKTLDHTVRVIPKSADAVPIAGTIIASLLDIASHTLSGKGAEGLFLGSEYRVLGYWRNPKVTPTRENDGLARKTWNTLRAIPWWPANKSDTQKPHSTPYDNSMRRHPNGFKP